MGNQQLSIGNPTFHALTLLSIKNDCEALKALVPIAKNPIYSLGLLQYMALFCCATEEYCKSTGQDVNFFAGSPFSISDIVHTASLRVTAAWTIAAINKNKYGARNLFPNKNVINFVPYNPQPIIDEKASNTTTGQNTNIIFCP